MSVVLLVQLDCPVTYSWRNEHVAYHKVASYYKEVVEAEIVIEEYVIWGWGAAVQLVLLDQLNLEKEDFAEHLLPLFFAC